jgi:hypothetical protein
MNNAAPEQFLAAILPADDDWQTKGNPGTARAADKAVKRAQKGGK